MFVAAQVSSMKTRRLGSSAGWRRTAMAGTGWRRRC